MDLEKVTHHLYGLPLSQFIAARNSQASDFRRSGNHDLADAVRKLRKPTSGAWLVNMLVRDHPDLIQQLLEIGQAMRQAQSKFDAEQLRRLAGERRSFTAALVNEARRSVDQGGHTVSAGAWGELEATLEAAVADSSASEAVRNGCLATPLSYSGLGLGLAANQEGPPPRRSAKATGADRTSYEPDGQPSTRKTTTMQRVRDAQSAAQATERQYKEQDFRVQDLREQRDRVHGQVSRLEAQLRDLCQAEKELADRLKSAQSDLTTTRRKLRTDRDRMARAQKDQA